ncbi:MAG: DUF308 domain-containing protein [Butyrivibrio sp.]|nr:DUF308 domain-containing protein [Butyrivibrio sp.]MBP3195648.1 DUF308 domain-containing protein [Butyrivibrio sp.]
MKDLLKNKTFSYCIQAILTIIIGVVLIIWTGDSIRLVARALAALLVLVGVVTVISYFLRKDRNVVSSTGFGIGIIIAAVGVWIFINPDTFTDFIPKLFGIFILLSGILNLWQTITLMRSKYGYWSFSLLFAVITVGMGIVLLLEPTFIKNIIVTLIGVFLIIDGGSNLWTISRVAKYVKEKQQEENAIDSEAVVVEEKRGR